MAGSAKGRIVLLGIMSRHPVAGVVWQAVHYLIGFRRLDYEVYYVEAHGATPWLFTRHEGDDGSAAAAAFIAGVMQRFGFEDRWAFHALHADGACFGLTHAQLDDLYRTADVLINLHGGTIPRPEHRATGRLVYFETDPVPLEIALHEGSPRAVDLLRAHQAVFTWGLNYGGADCRLPLPPDVPFRPLPPAVVVDLWEPFAREAANTFTTVGNWRQTGRDVVFEGEVYHWSKHHEFLKFVDLPRRTDQPFELALSSCDAADRELLERHGWGVRDAWSFSRDLDAYRRYVADSRAEFTVAKDQNLRLRTGWFSERSATYLAAGRPVVTQDTGFSNVLPTGTGLFAFSTMDEVLDAVGQINGDHERHRRAALAVAREHFSYDVVLPRVLAAVGL